MKFLSLFLILFVALSCTRNQKTSTSTIDLGSVGAQSTELENIRAVVINVSGSGMERIYYLWECHQQTCGANDIPKSVELTVPRGTQRLFQVLLGGYNGDNELKMKYGDQFVDLASAEVEVALSPADMGDLGHEMSIGGRYLHAGETVESGWVDTVIYPPNNRPPIVFESNYMFAGWFQAFVPSESVHLKFRLVMRDSGKVLFGEDLDLDKFTSSGGFCGGSKDNCLVVKKDPVYKNDAGSICYMRDPTQYTVLGFFGNGVDLTTLGYKAYYDNTSLTFNGFASDEKLFYEWDIGSCPSSSYYTWGGAGTKAGVYSGGTTITPNPISLSKHLQYNHENIGEGEAHEMGFKGPFTKEAGSPFLSASIHTGITAISFKVLPGVLSSAPASGENFYKPHGEKGLHGVDIFYNSGADIDRETACSKLEYQDGFTKLEATLNSTESQCVSSSFENEVCTIWYDHLGALTSNNQVVVCPFQIKNGSKIYLDLYGLWTTVDI